MLSCFCSKAAAAEFPAEVCESSWPASLLVQRHQTPMVFLVESGALLLIFIFLTTSGAERFFNMSADHLGMFYESFHFFCPFYFQVVCL